MTSVWAAICAAAKDIKRLPKDSRNAEQKYDFASVDDFLAMTGPICAKHGLTIVMDELGITDAERPGKYGPTFWTRYAYSFTVYDAEGGCTPTVRRTVEVIRTGAQSAGSAQSYALKQFLRATFQIPTGDNDDPDNGHKVEDVRQEPKRDVLQEMDDFAERVRRALGDIEKAGTVDELSHTYKTLWQADKAVAQDAAVVRAKDKRKAAFAPQDEIPY